MYAAHLGVKITGPYQGNPPPPPPPRDFLIWEIRNNFRHSSKHFLFNLFKARTIVGTVDRYRSLKPKGQKKNDSLIGPTLVFYTEVSWTLFCTFFLYLFSFLCFYSVVIQGLCHERIIFLRLLKSNNYFLHESWSFFKKFSPRFCGDNIFRLSKNCSSPETVPLIASFCKLRKLCNYRCYTAL